MIEIELDQWAIDPGEGWQASIKCWLLNRLIPKTHLLLRSAGTGKMFHFKRDQKHSFFLRAVDCPDCDSS